MLTRALLLCILFLFTACEDKEHMRLKVGISPWPGYEPLALASELGLFNEAQIRIVRFSTPTDSYRALRDGIIDVAAFTADELFHFAQVREKPRIFLILDISQGADAIVAKKEIKTLDGLKGKRIGVEGSALSEYLLHRALDFTHGLKISDLHVHHYQINEHLDAFVGNKIDALVTYEPSKSLLLNAGAHVLFDSSQLPHEIVDVLATNDETIQNKAEALTVLAQGWFKALDYVDKNYTPAMKKMARHEETTLAEFQAGYEDLLIPSKEQNLQMLGENGSLIKPMQKLSALMYAKGSLQKEIDIIPLLDSRIVKRIR